MKVVVETFLHRVEYEVKEVNRLGLGGTMSLVGILQAKEDIPRQFPDNGLRAPMGVLL